MNLWNLLRLDLLIVMVEIIIEVDTGHLITK